MTLTLNKASLENLWIQAGGNPGSANIAASIALAESGGNPDAYSTYDDDGSHAQGLWQIETPMHSAQVLPANVDDPLDNARAAVAISNNGADWTPWQTFTQGDYLKYLGDGAGTANYSPPAGGGSTTPTSTSSTPATSTTTTPSGPGAYGGLGGWLLKALLTVGLVGGGMVLAGLGVRGTLENTGPA